MPHLRAKGKSVAQTRPAQRSRAPATETIPIAERGKSNPPLRARTYAVILNAALRLYGREGYAAVTMRALAKEIGCSTGSIYNYFLDKHEIFSNLQREGLKLYAEAVQRTPGEDPVDDLREYFRGYYEFSKTHPEHFTLLWVDRAVRRFDITLPEYLAIVDAANERAQRCIDLGLFPSGTSATTVVRILWSNAHGPAVLRQVEGPEASTAEIDPVVNSALDLTLAGLKAGLLLKPTAGRNTLYAPVSR